MVGLLDRNRTSLLNDRVLKNSLLRSEQRPTIEALHRQARWSIRRPANLENEPPRMRLAHKALPNHLDPLHLRNTLVKYTQANSCVCP